MGAPGSEHCAHAVEATHPMTDATLRPVELEDSAPPPPRRSPWLARGADLATFAGGAALLIWALLEGASAMGYNWQWYRVPRAFYRVIDGEIIPGPLWRGLLVTLEITLWAIPIALAIGLATALLRLSRSWAGHALATAYLELVRNTPLLVQMYLFYFVLSPILGVDRFWTGVLCLAFFEASFISEIIRGGVLAVPRGQWEGASSLGLRPAQVYVKVVLPQATPLMAPPMTSAIVNLIKNSAIVSTIAIFDLTNQARNVIADTFLSFEIWLTVAAVYLVFTISLSAVAARLEARARRGRDRA
jgi:polar amino acid transport system permease protein